MRCRQTAKQITCVFTSSGCDDWCWCLLACLFQQVLVLFAVDMRHVCVLRAKLLLGQRIVPELLHRSHRGTAAQQLLP